MELVPRSTYLIQGYLNDVRRGSNVPSITSGLLGRCVRICGHPHPIPSWPVFLSVSLSALVLSGEIALVPIDGLEYGGERGRSRRGVGIKAVDRRRSDGDARAT